MMVIRLERCGTGMRDARVKHQDGRMARILTHEWREGYHPDHKGLILVKIQRILKVQGYHVVDPIRPVWEDWVLPDGVEDRVNLVLGPGWEMM